MWSAIRWHAYRIMGAMPYVDLAKNGIFSPKDLIAFPWDNDDAQSDPEMPTEDDIEEMKQVFKAIEKKK